MRSATRHGAHHPSKDGIGDLLAVLNSGYKAGATRPVLVPGQGGQWETRDMPTFAPVAMAGNNPRLPDDTRTRAIRIVLWPDLDGAVEESDWELMEDDAAVLAERIETWAGQIRDQIKVTRPPLPAGIVGRYRVEQQHRGAFCDKSILTVHFLLLLVLNG